MPLLRRRFSLVASFALLLVCSLQALADPAGEIDRLIRNARIGDATVTVHAIDLRTGAPIVAVDPGTPMIPASNMKLLSTGAALVVLGPDFVFRTRLETDGERLILVGDGDPALGDPRMLESTAATFSVDDILDALARAAADQASEPYTELVIDDRVFDRQTVHPGWPRDQLDRHYAAPVAGVSLNGNVLSFFPAPSPSGAGQPATFTLEPRSTALAREVEVTAQSVASGTNRIWIRRDPVENRFTLGGAVRSPSQVRLRVAIHDPSVFAGHILAERLAEQESRRSGSRAQTLTPRLADPQETFDNARTLAVVTTPLADVLTLCNTDSINLYAEALLKRIAHESTGEPGSWSGGATVMRMVLAQRLGPTAAASTRVSDGSGLSRDNAVSAETFTAWLRSLWLDPTLRDPFLESLAEPGEGTLRSRFARTKLENSVAAKSGSINGVRTLSGYLLNDRTGQGYAFSILINDLPLSGSATTNARALHEAIVAVLDEHLAERTTASVPTSE
ncbi:MAG: D-alanyl-D-alanine carboxypeptidase/D-alanyl-D-alanine-endopeptidase [Phycisphaerales bacterium JB037]